MDAPHQKGNLYPGDYIYLYKFLHKKGQFYFFLVPCMAQIAFYWLGLSSFDKKAPHMHITKATPNILIVILFLAQK